MHLLTCIFIIKGDQQKSKSRHPLNPATKLIIIIEMHTVSPIPDFEDVDKVERYMQDRRVDGVRPNPFWLRAF